LAAPAYTEGSALGPLDQRAGRQFSAITAEAQSPRDRGIDLIVPAPRCPMFGRHLVGCDLADPIWVMSEAGCSRIGEMA